MLQNDNTSQQTTGQAWTRIHSMPHFIFIVDCIKADLVALQSFLFLMSKNISLIINIPKLSDYSKYYNSRFIRLYNVSTKLYSLSYLQFNNTDTK